MKPPNPYHICLCAQARTGTALLQLWHPIFYQEGDLDDTARSTAKFGPYHTSGKETSNLVKGTTDGRTSQPRKQRPTVSTVHSGHGRFHVLRRTLRRPTTENPRRARRSRGIHAQTTIDSYPDHLHQLFNHPQWQKLPPTAKLSASTAPKRTAHVLEASTYTRQRRNQVS